jgi:hypothetical protein
VCAPNKEASEGVIYGAKQTSGLFLVLALQLSQEAVHFVNVRTLVVAAVQTHGFRLQEEQGEEDAHHLG